MTIISFFSFEYEYEAPADLNYQQQPYAPWYPPPEAMFSEVTRYGPESIPYYHYVPTYDCSNNNDQCE